MTSLLREAARGFGRVLAATLLVMLLGALSVSAGAAAVSSAPRPGTARIWIYRDYEPYNSLGTPYVRLNGAVIGISNAAGGSFYRDVAPGRYLVTVDSDGVDVNQSSTVDLVPGETVYIKVQASNSWVNGGGGDKGGSGFARDTFYARVMPTPLAEQEIAHMPFYGGG